MMPFPLPHTTRLLTPPQRVTLPLLITLCALKTHAQDPRAHDLVSSEKPQNAEQAQGEAQTSDEAQEERAPLSERARYERAVSLRALREAGWRLAEHPEGREVRALHTLRLPVFLKEAGGAWLTHLNALHVTTKPRVVLREARLTPGEPFSHANALETERNLRASGLFTSAQVFAVEPLQSRSGAQESGQESRQGSGPIDVLIITRDLWSLRLESAFEVLDGQLNSLALNLTERNVAGQRQALSLRTSLSPFVASASLLAASPRFGPDLSGGVEAGLLWGRESGAREGHFITLSLGRPLYNLDQRWSLSASVEVLERLARLTQGSLLVYDEPSDPTEAPRPIEWSYQRYAFSLGGSRQWSGALQRRLSLSLGGSVSERVLPSDLSAERAALWRARYINPSRAQLGPSVSYSVYERRFVALSDVSTYGLSEDLSVGFSAASSLSLSALGDRALTPALSLSYTGLLGARQVSPHAGFWRVGLSTSARLQEAERREEQGWVNKALSARLSGSTPLLRALGGRLVWSATLNALWGDAFRSVVSLGGDSGLRGYPAQALYQLGGHLTRLNLEHRSPPLVWSFVHLGGAVFYDAGAVSHNLSELLPTLHQSAGAGVRLLMPQLNRSVFRLDLAAPLNEPGWRVSLSVTSSQAFALMPWEG